MKFKVTTFNLRYDVPTDHENRWPHRVKSVVSFINQANSVLFGMQEVLDHMRKDLLKHLEDYSAIGMTRTVKSEAVPIFFKHDILDLRESGTFWLSKSPNTPDTKNYNSHCYRTCTWAEFAFKENRKIRFRVFNTHLDHMSKEAQQEGIKLVYNKIKTKNEELMLPTLVMGDFNVKPNDEVISYIKEETKKEDGLPYVDVHDYLKDEKNKRGTFHDFTGRLGGEPIDYIFVTPDIKILETTINREKIEDRYPSDHYPVSIEIEI